MRLRFLFCADLFLLSNISYAAVSFSNQICIDWFRNAIISPGFACTYDCMLLKTDRSTAHCPVFCPELCELDYGGVAFFNISKLYPGLSLAERALVAEQPGIALRAYANSFKAEALCNNIYRFSDTNDESDACRHYVWASLLSNIDGPEIAQKILDAHEDGADQPIEEKAMDLANNRAGLLACERLKKQNKCLGPSLMEEFKLDLNARRLVILKPKSKEKMR